MWLLRLSHRPLNFNLGGAFRAHNAKYRTPNAGAVALTLHSEPNFLARLRVFFAIVAATLVSHAIRIMRLGAGMTLPGAIALRIAPQLLTALTRGRKVVVVSGTNGKTTTARLISTVLRETGPVCSNCTGANLLSGIAAALILNRRGEDSWVVLEVDERYCEAVVALCSPDILVLTNIARDQLDRFGEVDSTYGLLRSALRALPIHSHAILNGDDPYLVAAGEGLSAQVVWYGAARALSLMTRDWNTEAARCPRCRTSLDHRLSVFQCRVCGLATPKAMLSFDTVYSTSPFRARFNETIIQTGLFGTCAAYNVLAAAAACKAMQCPIERFAGCLRNVRPPVARGSVEVIDGVPVTIMLSKNPASFALNIAQVLESSTDAQVIIAVNDRPADGCDLSWLWDVPFERLRQVANTMVASGMRAADVNLRMKYAGIDCCCLPDVLGAIRHITADGRHSKNIYLCCTYTVLLDLVANHAIRSVA